MKIDGTSYVLQEVFGFTELEETGDNVTIKECVICMSEAKDTLVLPCRHLCMCKQCAEVLRTQGRNPEVGLRNRPSGPPKCPICRQGSCFVIKCFIL